MTNIPGDTSTNATLTLGAQVTDRIDFSGDRDWYALTVAEDTFVSVTMAGTGIGAIDDTYLRLYDVDGNLLSENDDVAPGNLTSEIQFDAEAGVTYFVSAGGFSTETGDYVLSAVETTPPLLTDSIRWGVRRDDRNITYYFAPDGVSHPDADGFTSDGFNAYERARFEAAFGAIAAVANVSFTEVDEIDEADFVLILDDDEINQLPSNEQFAGFFLVESSRQAVGVFNADNNSWDREAGGGLEFGGDGYQTIVHEILHGMGLAHPHDDGGSSDVLTQVDSPFDDYGLFNLNQGIFTTMSYNTGFSTGVNTRPINDLYGHDAGPMAIDIAVLQDLYGANTTTAGGDDIYRLPDTNEVGTAWHSIWDTGGSDTILYDGTRNVTIDLRPASLLYAEGGGGFVSYASGIRGGLTIANGVVIENAMGGSGHDTLMGNDAANALHGNAGRDTIDGGRGNDMIYGGADADRLDGGRGDDNVMGGGGADQLDGGDGADGLYGGSGGDDLTSATGTNMFYGGSGFDDINGGDAADIIYAGSGDDEVTANGGDDTVYGGRGDDTINGGAGQDHIFGGMGQDRLTGGTDADHFVFTFVTDSQASTSTRDTITDFSDDDKIDLSAFDTDLGEDGDQAFGFVGGAAFSGTGAEVRFTSIGGGDSLVEIDVNGDAAADMAIIVLNTTSLTEDDFIL